MNARFRQSIIEHLAQKDVQARIYELIQQGRDQATVTISQAGKIFDFSESRLRDWEDLGLLQPHRPSGINGRRLYTPTELDKLAIIKELVDANFTPGDIPTDIYDLWRQSVNQQQQNGGQHSLLRANQESLLDRGTPSSNTVQEGAEPIDEFVERIYHKELFSRYFTSHLLHLILAMLCEETPDTIAGILLPRHSPFQAIEHVDDIGLLGECLVGWRGYSHTFYTFLSARPAFAYPSDYRISPLRALSILEEDEAESDDKTGHTHVIVQRIVPRPHISTDMVETIRRLLIPLYEEADNWSRFFGQGQRDWFDPLTDFSSSANYLDIILNQMTEMIMRLGNTTVSQESTHGTTVQTNRWQFCCILLPKDDSLPLPQQSLVVRAKSRNCPHRPGITTITPQDPTLVLSLRAFQGGNVIHRHTISKEDPAVGARIAEGENIHSAIAVPVGGEDGDPAAVIYIAANDANAFTHHDIRVVRVIGRMIEELLRTYKIRLQASERMGDIISNPLLVDTSFKDFLSEGKFIHDVEALLATIQETEQAPALLLPTAGSQNFGTKDSLKDTYQEDVVSFIAIDLDNQSTLANMYGYRLIRNLSRLIGQRVQGQFRSFFRKREDWQLYHIYADRFFVMLKHVPQERACAEAEKLRKLIHGSQLVDALRSSIDRPTLRHEQMKIDVTIRLVVTSYPYSKLSEILQRYNPETAPADVRSVMMRSLEEGLKIPNMSDKVLYWDKDAKMFVPLSPLTDDKQSATNPS